MSTPTKRNKRKRSAVTASLQTATEDHAFQSLVYITNLVGLVLLAYTAGHIYVNLVRCSSSSWT